MERIDKFKIFEKELNLISNENLRYFVEHALDETGNWFFEDPASTTGKNHPYFALGYGGLVRHTKAVVYFTKTLLDTQLFGVPDDHKDLLIVAAILHDIRKHTADGAYVENHARAGYNYVIELAEKYPELITKDNADYIAEAISTHMGVWGQKQGERIPDSEGEKVLHIADYLASRREIDIRIL